MFVSWSVPTLFPFNSFRISSQTFTFLTYLESFLCGTRDKNVISISQTHLLKMLSLFPICVLGTFVLDLATKAACIYFCPFSSPLFLWVICPFEMSIMLFLLLWLCKYFNVSYYDCSFYQYVFFSYLEFCVFMNLYINIFMYIQFCEDYHENLWELHWIGILLFLILSFKIFTVIIHKHDRSLTCAISLEICSLQGRVVTPFGFWYVTKVRCRISHL